MNHDRQALHTSCNNILCKLLARGGISQRRGDLP
jgi:hypothetical protein